MTGKLKIGVIGAGKFGGYHIQKCLDHAEITLTGVFDTDRGVLEQQANRSGVTPFENFQSLLDRSDALIIAAPAAFHGDLALKTVQANRHVLVEKPLAVDIQSAEKIVAIASRNNLIVQVGHQERFVVRAIGLDKIGEKPVLIRAVRRNSYSPRGTDTSVTMDLMTHDIDLVHWLMGPPKTVTARSIRRRSDFSDRVWAELEFDSGRAFLEAGRIAEQGSRTMEISYPSGTVRIDFNAKTLINETPFALNSDFGRHPEAKDSLAAGTNEFVKSIRAGRAPLISGQDGLEAVKTALLVDQSALAR